VCASSTASDDVTDATLLVSDVLYIDGVTRVTRLAMSAAEVGVSSTVGPLDFDNEAVDEQHDMVRLGTQRIMQLLFQLRQLIHCRELNVPIRTDRNLK